MHQHDYNMMREASLLRRGVGTPPSSLPPAEMVALPHAPAVWGISRREIYRQAAAGRIKLVKLGHRTLVDVASMRAFVASLPIANIRAA